MCPARPPGSGPRQGVRATRFLPRNGKVGERTERRHRRYPVADPGRDRCGSASPSSFRPLWLYTQTTTTVRGHQPYSVVGMVIVVPQTLTRLRIDSYERIVFGRRRPAGASLARPRAANAEEPLGENLWRTQPSSTRTATANSLPRRVPHDRSVADGSRRCGPRRRGFRRTTWRPRVSTRMTPRPYSARGDR